MEVMLGALPSLLPKLGDLLSDEYKLQKEVKGGIRFLQAELESMKGALEHISEVPADQLPIGDKIWARNVRELSYDIEDNIDTFMGQIKGHQPAKKHGFKKFIEKTLGSLMQPKIRRKIAIDIRDIKHRVKEVHERRCRYEVNYSVDKPVKVDPRTLVFFEDVTKLVGIDEARDDVIKILLKGNEVSKHHNNIVSIVGFGGLGKTTLANVVYGKLRSKFDCSAIISVSQTPDMLNLFKVIFNKLDEDIYKELAIYNVASVDVIIMKLREFLQQKRYFIIIDDIWDISDWNVIRHALPDNNDESRIITTTRNFTIAEVIGCPYKMKPLSLENSRILMYGRIFGKENKNKCPDEQLEEVLNKILKKCDGVPLAIVTIASLLLSKGRSKLDWYDVCNSIGAGLQEDNTIDNMRKVLSLSYYDMPSHLRTCLLYLSMFPEDYEITKDRLICLWIAEGFIQSGKQKKGLLEMGEGYLNELINRSMIQPEYGYNGMVYSCRIHDMVLDLICSISSEENYVTTWNNVSHSSVSGKVRRLSIQVDKTSHGKPNATSSMGKHTRSVIVFPSGINHVPSLENFRVLRVLDLEGCDLSEGYSLKYIGNLLHLRYLGLTDTFIVDHLPEEIGNLQFLQTLFVDDYENRNDTSSLPSTMVRLTQLMCLHISDWTSVPKGFRSLTALEELVGLNIGLYHDINVTDDVLEDLGHLTELKVLEIVSFDDEWSSDMDKSLVECLNKLHKIQSLYICFKDGKCNLDGWVIDAPRHFHTLCLRHCYLSRLPAWINPSLLLDLSFLEICVKELQQEDIRILGMFPVLHNLELKVQNEDLGIHGRFTVGACWFPSLVDFSLRGFIRWPLVFQEGAMQSLTSLHMTVPLQMLREINSGLDLGLDNLTSLQKIYIRLPSRGATVVAEAELVRLRQSILLHPNNPTLEI